MSVNDYYEVRVHCSNCGFKGKIEVLKSCLVRLKKCPECDCEGLVAVDAYKQK